MKHTKSTITAIKKLRVKKIHPRDVQSKNKEAFDKSFFGILQMERNL
jgi:hypothetical protein